jgi:capsular exopolysaccharide synthesis family protein
MARTEEAALGKFFEAMQRASSAAEPEVKKPESTVPELDDALLSPEGDERDDVFCDVGPKTPVVKPEIAEQAVAGNPNTSHGKDYRTPVIRTGDRPNLRVTLRAPDADGGTVRQSVPVPLPSPFPATVDTNVYRSPLHAAYERIIQRLLSFRRAPQQGVILFTSSISGEGTSTLARNTAIGLGRREREQVLLIDGNLRTPSVDKTFGTDREPGLSDVLLDAIPVTRAIRTDLSAEIDIMTAGSRVPSPAQVLSASALEGAVVSVMSLYDWIIFDSPAATSYPDASSIASVCGGAVIVVQAERTRQEVVEEAKRKLDSSGVWVLGAVLNRRKYHIPQIVYNRL